ncbi:MAG: cell division protein ZapA [Flavobacteriales bacterium]|nr:cell division protein ZapA [Flavobacteriales bacterium]
MADKNIKVKIANREYPLTVSESEEQDILEAAILINENIKKLKGSYVVSDYIDLLAMTALELATKNDSLKDVKKEALNKELENELDAISNRIDKVLSRS